jgi:glycosyltransferase involved in cell wall biosynthesis
MSLPAVSVVIPNYNYAQFLEERLGSILAQTVQDFEIVFLDDASTDNSVALVREKFGVKIQRLEINSVNSGNPFTQWNRGVRLARGEFVWIAEADDVCTPTFLENMLQALQRSSSIGLAYCNTVPIDTHGATLDAGFFHGYVSDLHPVRWHHDFAAHGPTEVRRYLARKNTIINVSGVLFRREAYVRAGYAPEGMRMCGDWLTYCRLLRDWDVAYLSAPMNSHRQHPAKHTQDSVLNLTYFREFLWVQEYVAEAFSLSKVDRRAAFQRFLGEWDRLTVSGYGRIGLRNTLTIAALAERTYFEPAYCLRIATHLVKNASKSMGQRWCRS